MTSNFPELLMRLALASSAAIALVLLLRRPLRAALGAASAYQLWLLVPLMSVLALLPALRGMPRPLAVALTAMPGAALLPAAAPQVATDWSGAIVLAWASGALATALLTVMQHRRFVRRLGRLTPRGALYISATAVEGPLLLGLWRPRLVLPVDFAQRYSASEQALIVAHEQAHAARRDPAANALLALLQCCCWFNPLVHVAAPRFRMDQELACDATVMAAHQGAAQAYAAALLKSQLDDAATPASCHWQSNHPLKERIMNLQKKSPGVAQRIAARLTVATLVLAGAFGTLAARADTGADKDRLYDIEVTMKVGKQVAKPHFESHENESFKFNTVEGGRRWEGTFVVNALGADSVNIRSDITLDGKPVSKPVLQLKLGQAGSLRVTSADGKATFELGLQVTTMPAKKAGA